MARNYVEVIEFIEGQGIKTLGVFENTAVAKFHIENTFKNITGKVITRKAPKNAKLTLGTIANDLNFYSTIYAKLALNTLNADNIEYNVKTTTLLDLVLAEEVKNARIVGKIEKLDIENEDEVAVKVVVNSETPVPFDKLGKKLQDLVLETLTGSLSEDNEEELELDNEEELEEELEVELEVEPEVEPEEEPEEELEVEPEVELEVEPEVELEVEPDAEIDAEIDEEIDADIDADIDEEIDADIDEEIDADIDEDIEEDDYEEYLADDFEV